MTQFDGPYDSAFDVSGDPDRAGNLKVRTQLMHLLRDYIDEKGFKQKEAANHFGVPQSRLSQLVNGRISTFTLDYLINMCSRAGIEVKITFDGTHVR